MVSLRLNWVARGIGLAEWLLSSGGSYLSAVGALATDVGGGTCDMESLFL